MSFAEKTPKDISILTKTHISHYEIHHQIHIRNNWLGPVVSFPGDSHTKELLELLHPGLEGITEVDIDAKRRPVSFKVTPSNDRVLCVYAPSGYSTREQQARGRFFKELQNYMENKNVGDENKVILEDFNCTMDKMDRYGGNKKQRLYRCYSNYALIADNGLRSYGEGRTQIPLSSPAMIGPLARIQDTQSLYWYKNC